MGLHPYIHFYSMWDLDSHFDPQHIWTV